MSTEKIDQVLALIRAQMDLDSETEHEVLEEIRSHLEEAVAAARAQGLDEQAALAGLRPRRHRSGVAAVAHPPNLLGDRSRSSASAPAQI